MKLQGTVIEVTQDDIDHGARKDCQHCPIALAANRTLGTQICGSVDVSSNFLTVWSHRNKRYEFHLPSNAREFIDAFDGYDPVQPFAFTL